MFELTNIIKEFLHRKVFDNFKLTFEAGKVYAIIGQSGSGKTTLLNMIAKLESYEGSILYEGKELSKIKKHSYFLNDLSYLFQNFGLIENETIDKNLDLGLMLNFYIPIVNPFIFAYNLFLHNFIIFVTKSHFL